MTPGEANPKWTTSAHNDQGPVGLDKGNDRSGRAAGIDFCPKGSATRVQDDFQTNLSQWSAGHAQIVTNPIAGGGNALNFNQTNAGGGIFSTDATFSSANHLYRLSYEYLGICGTASCGGYVGVAPGANFTIAGSQGDGWLAGDSPNWLTPNQNLNTGQWVTVSFVFDTGNLLPFGLKIEDFNQSGTNSPEDAYFRNLVLESVVPVPEPSTWAMITLGFAGIGFMGYRRSRKGSTALAAAVQIKSATQRSRLSGRLFVMLATVRQLGMGGRNASPR